MFTHLPEADNKPVDSWGGKKCWKFEGIDKRLKCREEAWQK